MRKVLAGFILLLLCRAAHAQTSLDTAAAVRNNTNLYAIVVGQHDKILYENYFNGKDAATLLNSQSLTKCIMSLLIGIAIDKKYIASVDEPIVHFFPALGQDVDKRKRRITIRDIMNQASGLWHEDLSGLQGIRAYFSLPNPTQHVLQQKLLATPADSFYYNNAATHLLSAIITRSTGHSTLAFAQLYLFTPLGIGNVEWPVLKDGYYDGSGLDGIKMHTKDLYKIGQLVLHKGVYNHMQIVSEAWISQLMQPAVTYATNWGFEGSQYGLCWYHTTYNGLALTYGLGWGGQLLILIPRLDAIAVVHQDHTPPRAYEQEQLFRRRIFPLVLQMLQR